MRRAVSAAAAAPSAGSRGGGRGPSSPTPVAATPPLRRRLPPRLSTPAKFDRGPSLVQKLADRHNVSLTCGFLRNIWFLDRYEADRTAVLEPPETPWSSPRRLPRPRSSPRRFRVLLLLPRRWPKSGHLPGGAQLPGHRLRPRQGLRLVLLPRLRQSLLHRPIPSGRDGLGLLFHRIKDLGEGIPLIKCWKLNHSSVQANFAVELPVLQCGLCIAQVLGLTPGLICSVPIDSKGRDKTEIVVKV